MTEIEKEIAINGSAEEGWRSDKIEREMEKSERRRDRETYLQ